MRRQDVGAAEGWRRTRCYLRSFEISGVLKIKVQIKPSHVSGSLSISEAKKLLTAQRERRRLGERSVLLPQHDEEEEEEDWGVVPGSKKKEENKSTEERFHQQ